MRHRSKIWVKLAARGRFTFEAKARINGVDYRAISAPKIHRALMTEPLSVGNCTAATMHLSILTEDRISAENPVTILGRLRNSKNQYSEWLEFGTFFINQRDTSYDGLITIDCYDAMLKANQRYVDGSADNSVDWPKTMKSVVEEIAYRIGVAVDPRTRINTGPDYVVPYPAGKSMIQVLGYIGACHGGNWIITEENRLRLVPLVTSPDETFHIIDADYESITTADGHTLVYKQQTVFNPVLPAKTGETPESALPFTRHIVDEQGNPIVTPEGYFLSWGANGRADPVDGLINVPAVTGNLTTGTTVVVSGISASDEDNGSYTAGDDSGYMLTIESNPYMTQAICDALYAAFKGLVYSPYTATKALYDPATELGDQVKIGDMVHSVIYSENLTFDLDFRSDITAPNSEELSEEYPYLTEFQKLKQSTEALSASITQTAKELTQTVEESSSDVTAMSKALIEEISRAAGAEAALGKRIGDEEARAKEAEKGLAERLATVEKNTSPELAESVASLKTSVGENTTAIQTLQSEQEKQGERITSLQSAVEANTTAISENATAIAAVKTTVDGHTETLAQILSLLQELVGGGPDPEPPEPDPELPGEPEDGSDGESGTDDGGEESSSGGE